MTPIKIRLSDSISLTAIRTDKFKTGVLSLSLWSPLTRSNSAHSVLISGVMRRGTEKYKNAAELNRVLDELYAASVELKSSRCGKNCVLKLSAELLDNAFITDGTDVLDGVCEILAQMLLRPKTENGIFTSDAVNKEKRNVTDSIKAEINNPRAYAFDRLSEMMHRNDADYPTLEEMLGDVDAVTPSSLYDYYTKLLSDSMLNVYYIGSEAPERVGEIIKKHFSEYSGKAMPPSPIKAEEFLGFTERSESMPVSQGKLAIGFRIGACVGEEEYFAATMFNEIFGGTAASKLFMNVREKMSLCYYCSSRYAAYTGNVTVSAGINVCDRERAYSAILEQLEDIKNGKISEAELTAARKASSHILRQIYDYPSDLISFYSNKAVFGIEATPEDNAKRLEAVTVDEIVAIANKVKLDSVFFLEGTLDTDDGEDENE